MIMQLENVSRRQNKLIHQLQNKVEIMSTKLQPAVSAPAFSQPSPLTAIPRLMALHVPASQPSVAPRPAQPSSAAPRPPATQRYPVLPETEPTPSIQKENSFSC